MDALDKVDTEKEIKEVKEYETIQVLLEDGNRANIKIREFDIKEDQNETLVKLGDKFIIGSELFYFFRCR